jgi:cytochrome b subunit of formate dehydrogenase
LNDDDERTFAALQDRLDDTRQALRRRYRAWRTRQIVTVAAFLAGTVLIVSGLVTWWPITIAGFTIVLVACFEATFSQRDRPALPRRRRGPAGRP